jgi:hypothetical protein
MKRLSLMLVCASLLATGCSSISVHHDYDTAADFATYRTYDWIEQHASLSGDARAAQQRNSLLDNRIRGAVDDELAKEGLSIDANDPDLYVVYHVGIQDKIDVTDWGYSYSGRYWGYGRDVDVYAYQEGTLIVDLIDSNGEHLVWRGTAQATVQSNPTPEKSEKRIRDAIAKMFQRYPPQ